MTEENLRGWYWDEELSLSQIAVRIGCCGVTVLRYMDKYGIPRRNVSESTKLAFVDPELRRDISERMKRACADPASSFNTEECRRKQSEAMKARWTDEEYRESMSGENSTSWKGGLVEHVCEICGCTFSVPSCNLGKFCSRRCMGVSHSRSTCGQNNSNWQSGTSFEPYPPEFNERFKCQIRERDNYTCAICGKHWEEGEPVHHVHHVNYDKSDTVIENCITLCGVCHSITNGDRVYWQRILMGLIWEKAEQVALPLACC